MGLQIVDRKWIGVLHFVLFLFFQLFSISAFQLLPTSLMIFEVLLLSPVGRRGPAAPTRRICALTFGMTRGYLFFTSLLHASAAGRGASLSGDAPAFFSGRRFR
jgi:hypothetical protein